MNFWLIVLFAQFLVFSTQAAITVIASIRERGEDSQFAGSKLIFRS